MSLLPVPIEVPSASRPPPAGSVEPAEPTEPAEPPLHRSIERVRQELAELRREVRRSMALLARVARTELEQRGGPVLAIAEELEGPRAAEASQGPAPPALDEVAPARGRSVEAA